MERGQWENVKFVRVEPVGNRKQRRKAAACDGEDGMSIETVNLDNIHRTDDGVLMRRADDGRMLYGRKSATHFAPTPAIEVKWEYADGRHHSRTTHRTGDPDPGQAALNQAVGAAIKERMGPSLLSRLLSTPGA